MKKIVTIFLLSLMLFNMAGYHLAFSVLNNIATEKLDARLDAGDYFEGSLVEIRVPLNMPYQNRVTAFERHYGEITIEGKAYTYVKMRIDGDMLVLKCIANIGKQQIRNTYDNLVKLNSGQDMENGGKKHNISCSKNLISDYTVNDQFGASPQIKLLITLRFPDFTSPVPKASVAPPDQPPRC